MTLPSRRTLRDYRNDIKPSVGFNKEVISELITTSEKITIHQKYVTLAFDEMEVKENLVFDKNSNELIGYVDIGDPELNYATFEDQRQLASHIFVYLVRGISSDLKFNLAHFATNTMCSSQIMSTFWEAVGILEITCDLHVIAAVSDGAPANRKFYDNHQLMDNESHSDIVHRTINIYAPGRYIFFFADAPHLLKTMRNCIYNSGDGKSRNMRNDGKRIIWSHLWRLVNDEMYNGIKLDSCLSFDHINLNPYSKINVSLATQILSIRKVSVILKTYYPQEMHATADLCLLMNDFFDCLNGRSQAEGTFKNNEYLKPFRYVDDSRFSWLLLTFLKYFENWKNNLEKLGLSNSEKNRMFVSQQTYDGIRITTHSVIGATKYLLNAGMPFVLTSRFNQDCRQFGLGEGLPILLYFKLDTNQTHYVCNVQLSPQQVI